MHITDRNNSNEVQLGELLLVRVRDTGGNTVPPLFQNIFDISGKPMGTENPSEDGNPLVGCFIGLTNLDKYQVVRRQPFTLTPNMQYAEGVNRIAMNTYVKFKGRKALYPTFRPGAEEGAFSDMVKNALMLYIVMNGKKGVGCEATIRFRVKFYH